MFNDAKEGKFSKETTLDVKDLFPKQVSGAVC